MFYFRSFSKLALMLATLLLLNSSYALELVTHQGHGHGNALDEHMEMFEEGSSHHPHQHGTHVDILDAQASIADAEKDCFCDEICCVSSTDFGNAVGAADVHPLSNSGIAAPDNYQSIYLELFLPPPTI
ncbi:MAG: hypothetical protein MI746_11845 [Pseudomonadales bacterium]|nr:hypothetical protein [Pseudomonadales bacterium]